MGGIEEILRRLLDLVERGVTAHEKLVELAEREPVLEVEPGPPVCPSCGTFNPQVETSEEGGQGALGEFVLAGKCLSCGEQFYGLPDGWSMHANPEYASAELKERAGR